MADTHPPRAAFLEWFAGAELTSFELTDMDDASLPAISAEPERVVLAAERGETSYFERLRRDHPDQLQAGLQRLREDIAVDGVPRRAGTPTILGWTKPT